MNRHAIFILMLMGRFNATILKIIDYEVFGVFRCEALEVGPICFRKRVR